MLGIAFSQKLFQDLEFIQIIGFEYDKKVISKTKEMMTYAIQ